MEKLQFAATPKKPGGRGTELEPETGTVGTVFPGTEGGTGTAGTEPFLSVKMI